MKIPYIDLWGWTSPPYSDVGTHTQILQTLWVIQWPQESWPLLEYPEGSERTLLCLAMMTHRADVYSMTEKYQRGNQSVNCEGIPQHLLYSPQSRQPHAWGFVLGTFFSHHDQIPDKEQHKRGRVYLGPPFDCSGESTVAEAILASDVRSMRLLAYSRSGNGG